MVWLEKFAEGFEEKSEMGESSGAQRAAVAPRNHVREGRPGEQISRFVQENLIDLIVMGTHGRTGLSNFLFGSVAVKVVRNAGCPVFTVGLR